MFCYIYLMDALRKHLRKAGKIGGKQKTDAQTKARSNNLARAREARWKDKPKKKVDTEHGQ
jgi:hypothetical protein